MTGDIFEIARKLAERLQPLCPDGASDLECVMRHMAELRAENECLRAENKWLCMKVELVPPSPPPQVHLIGPGDPGGPNSSWAKRVKA